MDDEDRRFRDRAWAATADLAPGDRQLVFDVVDEWLDDHPGGPRPQPEQLVRDVRAELGVAPAPARRPRLAGRRLAMGGALVVVVAAAATLRWWLTYEAAPDVVEIGWSSPDLEVVRSDGLREDLPVFRCEPGTIEARIGLAPAEGRSAIEVEALSVPLLDDGSLAERTSVDIMRDANGALDDVMPFTGARLDGHDWARLRLRWEIVECGRMDGFVIIDHVEVTYRVLGRTEHADVELFQPVALTTLTREEILAASAGDG